MKRGKTRLSAHTIRYYERIGLLPYAARRSYCRDYAASILNWIEPDFAAKEVFAAHPRPE